MMEFKDVLGNAVFVRKDDVVGIKADTANNYGRKYSLILLRGGHQVQVNIPTKEVMSRLMEEA